MAGEARLDVAIGLRSVTTDLGERIGGRLGYRKSILDKAPFGSVIGELEAIAATAAVEQRLFTPKDGDPVARFGRLDSRGSLAKRAGGRSGLN